MCRSVFRDLSCHIDSARRGMGQRMRHPAAVADHIQPFVYRLEMPVQLHFHIVELHLHAIEKGVVVRRARRDLIQRGLKSPGEADRVGRTNPSSILSGVLLLPRIRSPNRWTRTPPPSILERRAMLSPYPLLSLKGSEKCFSTKSAKFVFSVCFSLSSYPSAFLCPRNCVRLPSRSRSYSHSPQSHKDSCRMS